MVTASTYTVPVSADKVGQRLDRLLADAVPDLSRSRLKALIEDGRVRAEANLTTVGDPARRVRAGEVYVIDVPAPTPARPRAQPIPLDIRYEDGHVIVVNKPAGLVVHPATGNPDGTLVNALLAHCAGSLSGIGGITRPGIVHRLDKDTSGLIVAAKTDVAHRHLTAAFAEHRIERGYQAVVWGVPRPAEGEITGTIGRSPANRKKMAVVTRGGKPALTRYRVLRTFGTVASLVECRLATGRTHQIRVHMAARGHAVVGDPVYGGSAGRVPARDMPLRRGVAALGRQALHAYLIGFYHPEGGHFLRFLSDLPNDIKILIDFLYQAALIRTHGPTGACRWT